MPFGDFTFETVETCEYGNIHAELPEHTCPYQEDIEGDDKFMCQCCGECEQTCVGDI